jgi:hypothetical protein
VRLPVIVGWTTQVNVYAPAARAGTEYVEVESPVMIFLRSAALRQVPDDDVVRTPVGVMDDLGQLQRVNQRARREERVPRADGHLGRCRGSVAVSLSSAWWGWRRQLSGAWPSACEVRVGVAVGLPSALPLRSVSV